MEASALNENVEVRIEESDTIFLLNIAPSAISKGKNR